MSAIVYILPVAPRVTLGDPAWVEQYERQCMAIHDAMAEPPPRTRPILISKTLTGKPLIDGHRPAAPGEAQRSREGK